MNASPKSWNHDSCVRECGSCDGEGRVSGYDGTYGTHYCRGPYDRACSDCDETGIVPCPVCGSEIIAKGYDCIVCDMVENLPDGVELIGLAKAIRAAMFAKEKQS